MNRRSPAVLLGTLGAAAVLAACTAGSPTDPPADGADQGREGDTSTAEVGPAPLPEADGPTTPMDEFALAPRSADSGEPGELASVTVTEADGADRVVFDFGEGSLPGYEVEYVDRLVLGEDEVVPLDGEAALRITFSRSTPGEGGMTADDVPTNQSYAGESVRQLLLAENLAGTLVFGVGVTEEVEFRIGSEPGSGLLTVELKHP